MEQLSETPMEQMSETALKIILAAVNQSEIHCVCCRFVDVSSLFKQIRH